MYVCVDIFADMGLNTKSIAEKFYIWAYSLRVSMRAVRKQSINKYALGKNNKINKINVFEFISECKEVYEVESMPLDEIKDSTNTYKYIFENIKKLSSGSVLL